MPCLGINDAIAPCFPVASTSREQLVSLTAQVLDSEGVEDAAFVALLQVGSRPDAARVVGGDNGERGTRDIRSGAAISSGCCRYRTTTRGDRFNTTAVGVLLDRVVGTGLERQEIHWDRLVIMSAYKTQLVAGLETDHLGDHLRFIMGGGRLLLFRHDEIIVKQYRMCLHHRDLVLAKSLQITPV